VVAIVVTIGAAAATAMAANASAPVRDNRGEAVSAPEDAGRSIFLQSCASCHGPQGQGTVDAPSIQNAGAALADFVLRTGRMPLAAPNAPVERHDPAFDESQIEALVAYVAALGDGPPVPNVVTSGADLVRGRDLFVTNCAACHGPSGAGGAVGGGFVAPALSQADPTTVGEAVVSGPGPMPRFAFSQQDLNNLAAYVAYLRTEPQPGGLSPPEVGPVTEGLVAALALVGLLVVARFVGVRVTSRSVAATDD
jgi:ubiquinol-cytochrome c reductase cytochrome c subunit